MIIPALQPEATQRVNFGFQLVALKTMRICKWSKRGSRAALREARHLYGWRLH